jgi:hypothetical protein
MSSLFYVRNTFGIAIKWKRVILNAVKNLPSLHSERSEESAFSTSSAFHLLNPSFLEPAFAGVN